MHQFQPSTRDWSCEAPPGAAVEVVQCEWVTDLCSRSPRDCKGVLQHLEASDLTLGDSQDNRKG
jgi:hypothetical protein